jgi:hypothetical protein
VQGVSPRGGHLLPHPSVEREPTADPLGCQSGDFPKIVVAPWHWVRRWRSNPPVPSHPSSRHCDDCTISHLVIIRNNLLAKPHEQQQLLLISCLTLSSRPQNFLQTSAPSLAVWFLVKPFHLRTHDLVNASHGLTAFSACSTLSRWIGAPTPETYSVTRATHPATHTPTRAALPPFVSAPASPAIGRNGRWPVPAA